MIITIGRIRRILRYDGRRFDDEFHGGSRYLVIHRAEHPGCALPGAALSRFTRDRSCGRGSVYRARLPSLFLPRFSRILGIPLQEKTGAARSAAKETL